MQQQLKVKTLVLAAILFTSFTSHSAENEACLQHPKRKKPCPHLLYKAVPFKDEHTKLLCICVADFQAFLRAAKNEKEAALQKLERQDMAITLGMSEAEILKLLKR